MKTLFWTSRSKRDLIKLSEFYSAIYGNEKTILILEETKKRASILESPNFSFEKSGEIDQTFSHLKQQYRKLVHHHCKITYREGKEYIYVVRVFDTR